jgi:hypothetical protein
MAATELAHRRAWHSDHDNSSNNTARTVLTI